MSRDDSRALILMADDLTPSADSESSPPTDGGPVGPDEATEPGQGPRGSTDGVADEAGATSGPWTPGITAPPGSSAKKDEGGQDRPERAKRASMSDTTSDAAGFADDTEDAEEPSTDDGAMTQRGDWHNERSARTIIVELKRVESAVRQLLDGLDPKRKRKLAGTRRWLELEEDLPRLRQGGRLSEDQLAEMSRLIAKRHYLFRRLRFVSGTRQTCST